MILKMAFQHVRMYSIVAERSSIDWEIMPILVIDLFMLRLKCRETYVLRIPECSIVIGNHYRLAINCVLLMHIPAPLLKLRSFDMLQLKMFSSCAKSNRYEYIAVWKLLLFYFLAFKMRSWRSLHLKCFPLILKQNERGLLALLAL